MIGSEEEMRQSWGRKLPGATWSRTRACLNSIPTWLVARDVSDLCFSLWGLAGEKVRSDGLTEQGTLWLL